jgi:cyclophilin family peptidyl-prolyl cis-trans isomerase
MQLSIDVPGQRGYGSAPTADTRQLQEAAMRSDGSWKIWIGLGLVAMLAGCNERGNQGVVEKPKDMNPPVVSIPNGAGNPTSNAALDPRLHQPFEQACITEIDANIGVDLPPATTLAGKNCGTINDQVHKIWDSIKFADQAGKPVTYIAEVQVTAGNSDLGTIEILMQPELAPNHVRNFIALATLEYYDGLRFDRIVRQQGDAENTAANKLVLLEAGSPTEEADPATSHLGYWVKPEFNETAKHEEGSVGASLLEAENNEETAAVRFHINLTSAPAMDGSYTIFGKVIKGLDIAKRISELPVRSSEPGPDQGRPAQPITIQKVHIRSVSVQ